VTSGEEKRFRLDLHYDGSDFYGWQIQPERRTVQGTLQAAVQRVARVDRIVTGAGRTDRGVHATGQVASLELPPRWTPSELRRALNAVLPDDIWVEEVQSVSSGFHPRYDATARTYAYRLGTEAEAHSPFHRPFCWPLGDAVDPVLLGDAAARIPGRRSFRAFAKSGQPERGTVCRVDRAVWEPWDGPGLRLRITADRYLHHMVRYLVGTIVDVARGRRPLDHMEELLEDPETDLRTSPPAPPQGLFLARVEYGAVPGAGPDAPDPDPGNPARPGPHPPRTQQRKETPKR